ncbi:MAG TPA: hypothetical protein VJ875_07865 [Pyrinomonadaceae bacterium]|nr:hypothetical protein [Pyrinomonadaceae bacterium]
MKRQFLLSLSLGVFLTSSLVAVFSGSNQVSTSPAKYTRSEIDFKQFPIVDLAASLPSDESAKAIRSRKSKKYNNKSVSKISDASNVLFVTNETLSNLSALPVDKSLIVLLGEISDAKAYLSEDKTAVHSEFEVRIQAVLKNSTKQVLSAGESIAAERFGGRVRLPCGKLFIAAVDNQDMPRVGGKYLLFLTNDFIGGKHSDEDFNILMGYELKGGKVFPLDRTSSNHPIVRYNEKDESTLLTDLSSLLGSSATLPN